MIEKMKAKMEAEAKLEQKSYDEYACWCEDTLSRKAKDINDAKTRISALIDLVAKISGDIGVAEGDLGRNKKDIVDVKAAIKLAVDLRAKAHQQFLEGKSEAEQYMGALEAAINVLSKATQASSGFLGNLQEAQVVTAATDLKSAVRRAAELGGVSPQDLDAVRRFAEAPEEFLRRQDGLVAALQLHNDPFGDYSPKSSQIQGILKEMYDFYAKKLERSGGEEAIAQKGHLQLVKTKEAELRLVVEDLRKGNLRLAELCALRTGYRGELDTLRHQLKADLKLFDEMKHTCRTKAMIWSERCRLRTGEIQGIDKALAVLTSPEAQATFQKASTTLIQGELIQISSRSSSHLSISDVYSRLRALATRYDNIALAQIAVALKTHGSFEKVIVLIDQMIELLRAEAKSDLEHRDRCQTGIHKNENDVEDTLAAIVRAKEELEIANHKAKAAQQDLYALESEIHQTEAAMKERLELRDHERAEFKKSLKLDADSAELLGKAISALSSWYQANGRDVGLLQRQEPEEHEHHEDHDDHENHGEHEDHHDHEDHVEHEDHGEHGEPEGHPEYTYDRNKAPETTFDGEYKSMGVASGGIISMLSMLKENFEMEMKTGREDDAKSQAKYVEDMSAMQNTLDSQVHMKVALAKTLVDLKSRVIDLGELVDWKNADKHQLQRMHQALERDCHWVGKDFNIREEKRQTEIEGLMEAKNFLAGAE